MSTVFLAIHLYQAGLEFLADAGADAFQNFGMDRPRSPYDV